MKRKQILFAVSVGLGLCPMTASAQFSQDASAVTATVVRDPARQASTEIDAAIFNPAGTSFLEDGWHLSLNGNLSVKTLSVGAYESFGNKVDNLMLNAIPSLQAAYKKNAWAVSFSFANEGGYGTWRAAENPDLSLLFNTVTNELFDTFKAIPEYFSDAVNANDRLVSVAMQGGDLYNYSTRIGASYQINSHWSVYAGLRFNYLTEKTKLGINRWVYTQYGERKSPNAYFTPMVNDFNQWIDEHITTADQLSELFQQWGIDTEIPDEYRDFLEAFKTELGDLLQPIGETTSFTELINERNNSWGIAPVIGVDYHVGQFNFGAKYEFETKMHTGKRIASYHIPSLLSLGASWQPLENLKIAVGGSASYLKGNNYGARKEWSTDDGSNLFFNLDQGLIERFGLSTQHEVAGYTAIDYSGSISFSPIKDFVISAGYTYAETLPILKDGYSQSNCVFPVRMSHAISGGIRYQISPKADLDLGLCKRITPGSSRNCWNSRVDGIQELNVSAGISIHL